MATHGKFSSQLEDTYILAWNGKLNIKRLGEILQTREQVVGRSNRVPPPIELLVLSACETATGDQRAALGLAGVAVRSGARSTVASLWQVDDNLPPFS
jgi:CHAT domain-containing protein